MTSRRYFYSASFATGFAVMAGEIGIARLLAPFFGTSTPVWAFIIGTVMASLSVGYLAGGRLAKRPTDRPILPLLMAAAAVALLALPWLVTPLLRGSLGLFLRGSMGHLLTLALVAAPLFAVPFLLLGATNPLLLRAVTRNVDEVGSTGAWLYASGTWGGLSGTFIPGLVLVPIVGSRLTITFCGSALLIVAALGLRGRPRIVAAAVAVAAVLGAALANPAYATEGKYSVLHQAESPYQTLRVLDNGVRRRLVFNEGLATQSVQYADGSLPLADVWGYYALAPAWTTTGTPRDVLILGLGGGTSAALYAQLFPGARVTGVEIDPAVVDVGRRFFGLPAATRVVVDDARTFVARDGGSYDVILVDAFQFPYVPFQLATVEFFAALKPRLRQGGALVLNVGRDGDERDVVNAVATTLRQVFPEVAGVDVRNPSNTILVATHHPVADYTGLAALGLPEHAAKRLGALAAPQSWPAVAGSPVLTDDHAPVEWLTDRIFLKRVLRGLFGRST